MKAFITSVGERTTDLCKEQLKRYGFEPVVLGKDESWQDKYRYFINSVHEDCLRIDADIIPNKNIKMILKNPFYNSPAILLYQFSGYDFYRNNVGIVGILKYTEKALEIIRNNLNGIDWRRPEATAWRLPQLQNKTFTNETDLMGMHGFYQTEEDLNRHEQHKMERKQIENYDFYLARKILNL